MAKGVSHYTTGTLSSHRNRNILGGVSVDFEGDWLKARLLLARLPKKTRTAALKAQLLFAQKYKARLQENILQNGRNIGWVPLTRNYSRWKDRQNAQYGSSSMYRFHGTYYNSIDIHISRDSVIIGISKAKDRVSPHSGLRVSQYALILEMGSYSRGIKPRKLWGPSFSQIGGRLEILRLLRKELNMSVRSYGITLS